MKKLIIFLFIGLSCFSFVADQPPRELRVVEEVAFKRGELLKYRLHYGIIDAGTATLEVKEENKKVGGRNTFHVVGLGKTNGAFEWFYKVRDRYESYIDEKSIIPWLFIRRVNEGGFIINQDQVYNHYKNKVNSDGKIMDVPENIQDMLSAFYAARCMDFTNAKVNDIFSIPCFVDNEIWDLKIRYVGKETIKSDVGRIRCLKFRPIVQQGRIFKDEDDLNVWISDDKNHIPIRAQANILVGSIKMDLMEYSGLANPFALVEKKK